jgi:hypothetical protein
MTSEGEVCTGRKNLHTVLCTFGRGWHNESGLRQVRPACDLLYLVRTEGSRVHYNCNRIALDRHVGEDVDGLEGTRAMLSLRLMIKRVDLNPTLASGLCDFCFYIAQAAG